MPRRSPYPRRAMGQLEVDPPAGGIKDKAGSAAGPPPGVPPPPPMDGPWIPAPARKGANRQRALRERAGIVFSPGGRWILPAGTARRRPQATGTDSPQLLLGATQALSPGAPAGLALPGLQAACGSRVRDRGAR